MRVLVTALLLAVPLIGVTQQLPTLSPPKSGFTCLERSFVEADFGYAALPELLTKLGDSSVVAVPNAYGFTRAAAAGCEFHPGMRVKFEYARNTMSGRGLFAQSDGNAHGTFGLAPTSRMVAVEFDLWRTHRFHPFVGIGAGRTSVFHHFVGKSEAVVISGENAEDTFVVPPQPVSDLGMDYRWDIAPRFGGRFVLKKNLEASGAVYGKDSLSAVFGIAWFPTQFVNRLFGHVER
ncbi:MAG TPA: hypothetical protein VMT99_01075 [Candidatus Paceibacterota bacterium]|nr:hypothetical protein [Candidatus Paceibacterota bacterium]